MPRATLVGVLVAQTDSGVRVAVTGGGSGVFRHAGLEQALFSTFKRISRIPIKRLVRDIKYFYREQDAIALKL